MTGNALQGLLCAFSPEGGTLAVATADGRLRTYDTATSRLKASLGGGKSAGTDGTAQGNGHLAEQNTSLCWVAKQQGKKQATERSHQLVVGTASGDLKSYDTAAGELQWRCRDCVEGGVAAVACSSRGDEVYATGSSRKVVTVDASTGRPTGSFQAGRHALSALAASPDQKFVLVGSSSLALWALGDQERASKYTGHPTPVRAATFTPDGAFALSAAEGERHVAVWHTSPTARKHKKMQVAAGSLSLDEPAVQLHACDSGLGDGSFVALAVSEAGEAYVWLCAAQEDGSLKAEQLARIRVGGAAGKNAAAGLAECVMAARLQTGAAGSVVVTVARGAGAKPTFQQVTVAGPGSKAGAPGTARHGLVVLEPLAGGVLLGNEPTAGKAARAAAKADANDVKVLGRDGLDDTAMLVRATDGALTGQKRKVARELEAAPARADEVDEEEEEGVPQGPDAEQTLGARVAALEGTAAGASGQDDAAAAAPLPAGSQKADSLVVLLTQALRSNDRALLERCIATSNDRIITNTVRRLLPIDAAAFLRAAVERLQSKPSRGAQLATWIRAVLLHHTAYLMAAPGVQPSLAGLYQTIEARLQMHRNLLSLSGRLDLLLSQASRGGADGADDGDEGGPLTYYEEGDEDEDVAVEDPFALAEGDDALPSGDDDDEDDDDDDEGDEDEDEGGDGDDHMMGLGDDDDFDDDDE